MGWSDPNDLGTDYVTSSFPATLGQAAAPLAGAAFPWLPLLMSFAPMALSGLFGANDPARERERRLANLSNPAYRERVRQMFLKQLFGSAGFATASRGVESGALQSQNMMSSALARSGIGRSGIGSIAPGLAHQALSMNKGRLNAAVEGQAGQLSDQSIQAQIGALSGTPLAPNYLANLAGAGFNAFGPLAMSWARKKYELPSDQTRYA